MNRRLFALILLVVMLSLLACGCGKEDAGQSEADPTTQPTTTQSIPTPDDEPTTEMPTEEETTLPPESELDWMPAAPSGSVAPTDPEDDASEPAQEPTEEQESTENSEPSGAEQDGVEEDYTPWG